GCQCDKTKVVILSEGRPPRRTTAVEGPAFTLHDSRYSPEQQGRPQFPGSRFAAKSTTRLAAGGSWFTSAATTYPAEGHICSSPFIPGAPPPCPKQRVPFTRLSSNPNAYVPSGVPALPVVSI